ncbi:MAG: MFS transporter [Pseudomonadota bacterium]
MATFAPLRNRNIRRYLVSQGISLTGTWMQNTAAAWLVWELSHSATALGLLAFLGLTPFLILGPWMGVWADRVDRRRLLLATQTASMSLAFLLAILVGTGEVRLWHVYLLAFLFGSIATLDLPGHQAFLNDLSDAGEVGRTFVVEKIIYQLSRLVGPPIAGLLISTVGTATVFWLNGLSFVAVLWALRRIEVRPSPSRRAKTSLAELLEGVRFLGAHRKIQYLFLFSLLVAFFGFSSQQMLAAYASQILHEGPRALGFLMGASGLGALAGSLWIAPRAHRARRIGVVLCVACCWIGISLLGLAGTHSLPLAMGAMAAATLAMPVVMVTSAGMVQLLSESGMRARMASLWMTLTYGLQPCATFLVGWHANAAGVGFAIGMNGALIAAASLSLLALPDLRKWINLDAEVPQ